MTRSCQRRILEHDGTGCAEDNCRDCWSVETKGGARVWVGPFGGGSESEYIEAIGMIDINILLLGRGSFCLFPPFFLNRLDHFFVNLNS